MKKRYPKRVNPETMLTRFEEIFKSIGMKKPTFCNLLFVLIAIGVAQTFRINEIASRWSSVVVKREKSKQKRFLRFLDTPLSIDALKAAYFMSVVGWFFKDAGDHLYLLIDETDLMVRLESTCRFDTVIRRTSRYRFNFILSETRNSKTRCILSQIACRVIRSITATNTACRLNTGSEI